MGIKYDENGKRIDKNRRIKRSVRLAVYTRSNGYCYWCGRKTVIGRPHSMQHLPDTFTIDHIVPRALGGTNQQFNLACCCYECNHKRGSDVRSIR